MGGRSYLVGVRTARLRAVIVCCFVMTGHADNHTKSTYHWHRYEATFTTVWKPVWMQTNLMLPSGCFDMLVSLLLGDVSVHWQLPSKPTMRISHFDLSSRLHDPETLNLYVH